METDNRTDAQKAEAAKNATASADGAGAAKDQAGAKQSAPLNVAEQGKAPSTTSSLSPNATDQATRDAENVRRQQAILDDEREQGRAKNVSVNNPRAPEAVARQHDKVDQALERRSEQNREGHERNMQRETALAEEAQARTAHADDHRANHVPTGKQENRNTPRILKDGTKVWDT
jgi:hypothetical protein